MKRWSAYAAAIAFSVLLAASASAKEQVHWTGAGWYGIGDDDFGTWILAGPMADQATCTAGKPADHDDVIFSCEYLAEKPGWDE